MTIRTIKPEDHEALYAFWKNEYFVTDMDTKERFKLFLEKNSDLSVLAENNGIITGTALGSYDGRRGYLQKVVITKHARKQGIGRQLVTEVISRLTSAGAISIPISVDEKNVAFYTKCGFTSLDSVSMSMDLSY